MPSAKRSKERPRPTHSAARSRPARPHARSPPKKAPKKPVKASKAAPAKAPPKSSAPKPAAKPAPKGASADHVPEADLAVLLPGGRRHVLSLAFVRDGDEFLARLETDAGHITELKNRSLDQLLTLVAGELEDLLE